MTSPTSPIPPSASQSSGVAGSVGEAAPPAAPLTAPRAVITPPPELPPTPRAVTPAVGRVMTFEPRVRFWLLIALVFLGIGLYFGLTQMTRWASDRALVLSGVQADAVVLNADGSDIKGQRKKWIVPVRLEYVVAGKSVQVNGLLAERPESESVVIGSTVKIRYDATDPTRWTDRITPQGFAHALISVYVMVPIALMAALVGLWQRWRLLSTWRSGKLTAAAVLSVTSSPIAPGYSYVTAAPTGSKVGSLTVYVPKRLANPMRGDVIWLIMPERGPALAARAFL